jgi:hypothetical protein
VPRQALAVATGQDLRGDVGLVRLGLLESVRRRSGTLVEQPLCFDALWSTLQELTGLSAELPDRGLIRVDD